MREIKFERTVWAERQLAKLCPNNDISQIEILLTTDNFDKQIGLIIKMIVIMNEAYERKAHFLDNTHEMNVVTEEELEYLTERELLELSNKAFADFAEGAKTEIETTPKKDEAETKSI